MKKLHEYDMVTVIKAVGNVPADTVGTIVFIHGDHKAYDVEFVVNDKNYVETVIVDQLKLTT